MARVSSIDARDAFKKQLRKLVVLDEVQLLCDHCGKVVPTDMAWRCGSCGQDNHRGKVYSFLNKCQKCEAAPKAYVCPHCRKFNFLDEDKDGTHAATAYVPPPKPKKPEVQPDPRVEKRRGHADRKEDLQQEIEIAELTAKLALAKAPTEPKTQPSEDELMAAKIESKIANLIRVHKHVTLAKAKAKEEYKDHPDLLAEILSGLEAIKEDEA